MPLTPGTILRQYEILEPIGAGSMGEVYRALDRRLSRHVAIKILPARLADDPEARERFEREARAVAALSHPGILAIHEFTATEDTLFAVMELLEGETLRARLARAPLPWTRAIDVAAALADGLGAAHGKGVIHRDLKPENIFLSAESGVKILDFGLARRAVPAALPAGGTDSTLSETVPGMLLGTIGYMPPEQIQGLPADARSDIFALGCVLYEMLTGRRPFDGATPQEILAATLRNPAPRLPALTPPPPPEIDQVIERCLAKSPDRRFAAARDLAFALRALLSGSGAVVAATGRRRAPRTKSIAVLPFQNVGDDRDLEYLSDGLTESIINSLSQLSALRVVPRSSVFRYKGAQADPGTVALALNARTLLTGRVTTRGDVVNIQAELVDAGTESQLWGEQYRRPLAEIQTVQEEIAWHISEALRIRLTGEQKKRLRKRETGSGDAYQQYLRGRYHWNRWTADGFRASLGHFERAIAADPKFALAWAGLGDAYGALAYYHFVDPAEAWAKARDAAERAAELDETLPEAHVTLGLVAHYHRWSWAEAEREFTRALQIRPTLAIAHSFYGFYLTSMGRPDDAVAASRRGVELDPLSLVTNMSLGWTYNNARRFQDAIAHARRTLELDPCFQEAHVFAAVAHEMLGEFALAARHTATGLQCFGCDPAEASGLAAGLRTESGEAYWQSKLDMLAQMTRTRPVMPELFAIAHAQLGDADAALTLLERLAAQRSGHSVFYGVNPAFDPLRGRPRFEALLQYIFGGHAAAFASAGAVHAGGPAA